MTTVDAGEFRAAQREQWDGAAGGWRRWTELIESGAAPVSRRLVELAEIGEGDRVLDIAAGYGEPTVTAARAVGDRGRVVATDIAAEMLSQARERVAEAGLENIEFVHSEASALDLDDGSFDAALSRWGLIFEPDGEGTAGRVRAALKEGGRFAISSWAGPEQVPMLGIPMRTAMERLDVAPPPPGTPGPLSRPTAEAVGALLEGGGFRDVAVEELDVVLSWGSPEDFTQFVRDIAPPVTALLEPHPEDVRRETWEAITEAVRERADDDGGLTLTNVALLATGTA